MDIESFSATRGQAFDWCTFKYYLTYMLDLGKELYTSKFAAGFGSAVHEALEVYARNKGLDEEIWRKVLMGKLRAYDVFEDMKTASKRVKGDFYIEKNCFSCPAFREKDSTCHLMHNLDIDHFQGCPAKLYEQACKMMTEAINRYDELYKSGVRSKNNSKGKMLGIEQEFTHEIGEDKWGDPIIIHGYMDLVFESDPETVEVVDYKTGFKTQKTDELMKDLQARLYALASRLSYPDYKYHLITFDYFRGSPIMPPISDRDCEQTKKEIIGIWNKIKAQKTVSRRPRGDFVCKYLCNREVCDEKWDELKGH